MLLKPWIIFTTLYIKFSFQKENYLLTINFVTDFIKVQTTPTALIGRLCWPKDARLKLRKELSENYIHSEIRSVGTPLHRWNVENCHLFLLDAGCEGFQDVLLQAQELNLFNHPFRWLILAADNDQIYNNVQFGVDSLVYIAENTGPEFRIKSIYKYTKNTTDLVEYFIGNWSSTQGFSRFTEISATRDRSNLMGTVLKITYVFTDPDTHNHLWDYRNTHIDALAKVFWFVVHHLVSYVNGTSINSFRQTWGYKNATTSLYSGMIGDLQTGNADIGASPCFFITDRIDIIEYIAATTPTFMRFVFKAPPLTYVTNVFTLPFDTYVWYCCFAMIASILGAIYVIVEWEWRDPIFKKKPSNSKPLQPNIFDVFLLEIGTITQQGTDDEPRSNAGRIATIVAFIAVMFLYTSYSANIVALLQSTTESIRTLEDLLNSRISLGVEDIIYAHYYFENAKEPIMKAIYEQKVAPKGQKPNFMAALDGMRKVQQGSFGFHTEQNTAYKIVNKLFLESEKCSLKEIEYINLIEPWLPIQKNSSYKEIFKVGLRKIRESGIQSREVNRVYTKKPKCHGTGGNFVSVGLIDCYAAFLIFGIGVGCSLLLMVLEVLVKRYQMKKLESIVVPVQDFPDCDTYIR